VTGLVRGPRLGEGEERKEKDGAKILSDLKNMDPVSNSSPRTKKKKKKKRKGGGGGGKLCVFWSWARGGAGE